MKAGFVSVSVLELVYKSAFCLGQTGSGGLVPLDPSVVDGVCSSAKDFVAAMKLREPCIGGSRVGFGVLPR